jgi:hypothetical protein
LCIEVHEEEEEEEEEEKKGRNESGVGMYAK